MKWLWLGTCIVLVIVIIKYGIYRWQIREICHQLVFLKKEETNKRVQTDLSKKEILELANQINQMIDEQEHESLLIRKKETQLRETLTNISHDIRTPLTSMKGFFELLVEEKDEAKKLHYERTIRERMEDLSYLLEELFTYTKLQNETYELVLEQQDFTRLVMDSLFSFYEQWKEKNIKPDVSIDEKPVMIMCNDIAVKRILTNVLRNAMIHGNGQIEICYKIKKDGVLFQCYNGCGDIEELEIGRVFERFYKADAARSESSSGLGLSIASELTQRMSGTMEARIEQGRFLVEVWFRMAVREC